MTVQAFPSKRQVHEITLTVLAAADDTEAIALVRRAVSSSAS